MQFFDDALITQVHAVYPYSTDDTDRTYNQNDSIALGANTDGYNAFAEYVVHFRSNDIRLTFA